MGSKNDRNVKLGRQGETLGVQYLKANGFRPVATNYRTRFGEIDIVARRHREYFFIEVKTRRSLDHGSPLESLPFYRVERLQKMALYYAAREQVEENHCHLSLLGIDMSREEPKITFIKDIIE